MSCGRIGLLRRKLLSASTVLGSQRTTTMSVRWSSCLTSRRKIPGWLGLRTRFESKQSPLIRPKQKVVVDLRLVTNFPSASPPHETAGTVSTFGDLTSNFTAKMSPILTEWLSDWIQPNARWIMLLWTSAAWVAWRRAQQFNFSFNSYHMLFPSTSKPRSFVHLLVANHFVNDQLPSVLHHVRNVEDVRTDGLRPPDWVMCPCTILIAHVLTLFTVLLSARSLRFLTFLNESRSLKKWKKKFHASSCSSAPTVKDRVRPIQNAKRKGAVLISTGSRGTRTFCAGRCPTLFGTCSLCTTNLVDEISAVSEVL